MFTRTWFMTMSIQTREIQYTAADGSNLSAYFAAPTQQTATAGVIVAPEWWGRNEYTEQRARELAEQGYAALAIDMYGDKKVTTDAKQAYEWMMQTFEHSDTLVIRATAALETLAKQPEVDATRLAAIGFCYGGKVVLDLARSGADLKAVATFHAVLATQTPAQQGQIKAEILVSHGALDSMVSLDDVENFKAEMNAAAANYQVLILENAKHGFSNPLADERAKANQVDLGYDAVAEKTSLAAMYELLNRNLK
ncbi:dienelactone hydrolase family protein [Acinetobacter rudis]|uniref:Dienelactone hydrolase family protein n=1 Tax=Acinetobacter rudis TaxID=632955 RepID=A0AAW8J6D6_9GAMM|nr:dienelactone hydrolase family protein [Acinetobacter rudis]MDQ8934251.1 dienelactone hydrolase family protein [Acinetobacter rudis]MDQ9016441.1 dienelactone hydrolase family protein [Acinetobacter rudis]